MNYTALAEGIFYVIYALAGCYWLADISYRTEKLARKMAWWAEPHR